MTCYNCGCIVDENQSYCPNCGSQLKTDQYEQMLIKKQELERFGTRIWKGISVILDIIIFINNLGSRDILEILIICGMIDAIIYAIYGVIAAALGFFKSGIYLEKYRQLREEVGKTEAVKIIEQTYHPERGFDYMKNIIIGTGSVMGGCFSSIIAFAVTIIAVVVCMALC